MFLEVYLKYIASIYLLANFVVYITYIFNYVIIEYMQRKLIILKNEKLWLQKFYKTLPHFKSVAIGRLMYYLVHKKSYTLEVLF